MVGSFGVVREIQTFKAKYYILLLSIMSELRWKYMYCWNGVSSQEPMHQENSFWYAWKLPNIMQNEGFENCIDWAHWRRPNSSLHVDIGQYMTWVSNVEFLRHKIIKKPMDHNF